MGWRKLGQTLMLPGCTLQGMRTLRYVGSVALALLALSLLPTSLRALATAGGLMLVGMAVALGVLAWRLWPSRKGFQKAGEAPDDQA